MDSGSKGSNMVYARMVAIFAIGFVSSTHDLEGQGLSRYRTFALGSNVASVSTLAEGGSSAVKTIHQRPALLQDLEWRPSRWASGSTESSTDPVEQILFSFYDDQLFRIIVDYGQQQTEGMTREDMIEAISTVYGTPIARTPHAPARTASRLETESGSVVARWGDAAYAVVLYQTATYGSGFRLIVKDAHLADLARDAETRALRLDDQEAPQKEIGRQKKQREEESAAAAKARAVNKRVFRP
jgi:hypothetical protein